MAKLPFMQFYPADWIIDTQVLTLSAKGAWIDVLCQLWISDTPGVRTWNIREFTTLLRLSYDEEIEQMVSDLSRVAEVTLTDADDHEVKNCEDCAWITIKSRRIVRDWETLRARKETHKRYNDKRATQKRHGNDMETTPRSQKSEVRSQKSYKKEDMSRSSRDGVSPSRNFREEAKEVLAFLNGKTGKSYRPVDTTLTMIMARLKGHGPETAVDVQTCKSLIAKKVRDWSADEKMSKYLRPETLFNRTKFESYLGELNLCVVQNATDSCPTTPQPVPAVGGHLRLS